MKIMLETFINIFKLLARPSQLLNFQSCKPSPLHVFFHQLTNQCKLTLDIFGEGYQDHISLYFHNQKLSQAFATEKPYLNGGFYAEKKLKKPLSYKRAI